MGSKTCAQDHREGLKSTIFDSIGTGQDKNCLIIVNQPPSSRKAVLTMPVCSSLGLSMQMREGRREGGGEGGERERTHKLKVSTNFAHSIKKCVGGCICNERFERSLSTPSPYDHMEYISGEVEDIICLN